MVEDSLSKIVAKVVNKNLFLRAFSEISCVAGSNYVPILSAAMDIFSGSAPELKIPLLKGFVPPTHFQRQVGW